MIVCFSTLANIAIRVARSEQAQRGNVTSPFPLTYIQSYTSPHTIKYTSIERAWHRRLSLLLRLVTRDWQLSRFVMCTKGYTIHLPNRSCATLAIFIDICEPYRLSYGITSPRSKDQVAVDLIL